MDRIADIIDELQAARLLDHEGEILERHEKDPGCRIHIDSCGMAGAIADFLRELDAADGISVDSRLIDYANQLHAHHLDMLDRLDPV